MLQPSTAAPDFELTDLDGRRTSLGEALKQGSVLLAFFKINCPTCQLTFPFLQRLMDGANGAAPRLIAVSQDNAADSRQFQKRFGLTMPTLVDEPGPWPVSNAYRISSVPSIFLVEANGLISRSFEGFNKSEMEKLGERFGVKPFGAADEVPAVRPG
jgi:peroxiredoxin